MTIPYKFYRHSSPGNRTLTSYKLSTDVCSICGGSGGAHYSEDGISWCYKGSSRDANEDNPKYQTSFSYSVTDKSNPNTTFKNKRMEE
jgi:hypothetical protein